MTIAPVAFYRVLKRPARPPLHPDVSQVQRVLEHLSNLKSYEAVVIAKRLGHARHCAKLGMEITHQ